MALPCRAGRLPAGFPSGLDDDCARRFRCGRLRILLTYPRTSRVRARQPIGGLYLHSPALEGMWMGALQEHAWKGCARASDSAPPFPILHAVQRQGEMP